MRLQNNNIDTSTRRVILKPRCAYYNSSCSQKAVASGVRVDARRPVAMAAGIVVKGQDKPTLAGQPSYAYSLSSGDAG